MSVKGERVELRQGKSERLWRVCLSKFLRNFELFFCRMLLTLSRQRMLLSDWTRPRGSPSIHRLNLHLRT